MKVKKERQSNIELLRIVAMAMIVIFHVTLHSILPQLKGDMTYMHGWNNFDSLNFFKKLLIPQTFMSFGNIGNGIFILIAGYFLAGKKIDVSKSIKKLLTQALFAAILITICSFSFYYFHSRSFLGLQPVYLFNGGWWFIGYYLGIIIFASLFLNKYLKKLTKNKYKAFLLILFTIISISWLANILSGLSDHLHIFVTGIFLYSFGGYIKKYEPFKNIRTPIIILLIFISYLFIWFSYYNVTIGAINKAIINGKTHYLHVLNDIPNYSFIIIALAVLIFELFKRIKIPNSKIINYIASTTFMIYLVHENDFFRGLYRRVPWVELYSSNMLKFFLLYLEWFAIAFAFGIISYFVYTLITKFGNTKIFHKIVYKK